MPLVAVTKYNFDLQRKISRQIFNSCHREKGGSVLLINGHVLHVDFTKQWRSIGKVGKTAAMLRPSQITAISWSS